MSIKKYKVFFQLTAGCLISTEIEVESGWTPYDLITSIYNRTIDHENIFFDPNERLIVIDNASKSTYGFELNHVVMVNVDFVDERADDNGV